MSIGNAILGQLSKEIEGTGVPRSRLAKMCRECPASERKSVLRRVDALIRERILASTEGMAPLVSRWRGLEITLTRLVSLLSTKSDEEQGWRRAWVRRAVRQSLLQQASGRREQLAGEVTRMVQESLQGSGSAQLAGELRLQVRLLQAVGEGENTAHQVVKLYLDHAREHLHLHRQLNKELNVEQPGSTEAAVSRLVGLPGVAAPGTGLGRQLQLLVWREVAPLAVGERALPRECLYELVAGRCLAAVDQLVQLRLPKKETAVLQEKLRWGVAQCLKDDPFGQALEMVGAAWPPAARAWVRRSVREALAGWVAERPDEHSRVLLRHLAQLFQQIALPKITVQLLRVIAEQVGDTVYFEESLIALIVNSALKGAPLRAIRRGVRRVDQKWPFLLKRRIKEVLRDFAAAEPVGNDQLYLIHANSFRWPANLDRLDLPDIPGLASVRQKIVRAKKKERVKVEWVDSLSTVDLEIDEVSTTVSLLQYYLIRKIEQLGSWDIRRLRDECQGLGAHLAPLVSRGILVLAENMLSAGPEFGTAAAWNDLAPPSELFQAAIPIAAAKKLTVQSIDCYLTRSLKKRLKCSREALVSETAAALGQPASLVSQRVVVLVGKGLIAEQSQVLEYLP